jgi:hypothetical protein
MSEINEYTRQAQLISAEFYKLKRLVDELKKSTIRENPANLQEKLNATDGLLEVATTMYRLGMESIEKMRVGSNLSHNYKPDGRSRSVVSRTGGKQKRKTRKHRR